MKILAINPGSTSTKIAVYNGETPEFELTLRHSVEQLAPFGKVINQRKFRHDLILDALVQNGFDLKFDAVIGRGGLSQPIPGGVYDVNDQMVTAMLNAPRDHACNLGPLIARDIADEIPGCRALIADPGIVDEMDEVARISGSPLMPRISTWHALNQRAIGRRFAKDYSREHPKAPRRYSEMNLIIVHLGGGISIGAHAHGRCIDVNNAFDGEGPFSPERAGSLPSGALIDICFSGRFTKEQLKKRISGHAGLAAHLGTTDVQEIERRIADGDEHARLILDAMIYHIAKSIGSLAPVIEGNIDAILVTGGIAHSQYVIERLRRRVEFLAPVHIYPGEDELKALAGNAIGALTGELPVNTYHLPVGNRTLLPRPQQLRPVVQRISRAVKRLWNDSLHLFI